MNIVNILIAGVGGQGLVLTTEIIAKAAFFAGYEVATNDVIGLSQRGGKINGSIRFGEKVPTPNVPSTSASVLLGLEKLETLRFVDEVIPGGTVLMNRKEIYPNPVLMEKEAYPSTIEEEIQSRDVRFLAMDSDEEAKAIGNIRVANTILIGALSTLVAIEERHFAEAIVQSVPPRTIRANLQAFIRGRELLGAPVTTELPEESPKKAQATPTAEKPYAEEAVKEPHPMDPTGEEMSVTKDPNAAPKDDTTPNAQAPEMEIWICTVCGYAYDPVAGDPDHDVAPGTRWEEVPEDWTCPLCGVSKDRFERQ